MKNLITTILVLLIFISTSFAQYNTFNISFVDTDDILNVDNSVTILTIDTENDNTVLHSQSNTLINNDNFNSDKQFVNIQYDFGFDWLDSYRLKVEYDDGNKSFIYNSSVPFANTTQYLAQTDLNDDYIKINTPNGSFYVKNKLDDDILDTVNDSTNIDCESGGRLPTLA